MNGSTPTDVTSADAAQELRRFYTEWKECNAAYEQWAKAQGLSVNAAFALLSLMESKAPCTQKTIRDDWDMPKQTVNSVLRDFTAKGYVHLTPLKADSRSKQIELTEAGREYAQHVIGMLHAKELRVMQRMGVVKVAELNDLIGQFTACFRNDAIGQPDPTD